MSATTTRPRRSRPEVETGQASADTAKRATGVASIRERLVITILLLTFFGIGMSGSVAYVLQWGRIQSQAYSQLSRDASDFRELANANIDAGTGKPFTNVSDLLRGALQSKTLSESGGILGIVDGKLVWKANSSVTVRPENDPGFVALALQKAKLSTVTTDRYSSRSTDYAYLVFPVVWSFSGETGALVRVVDLNIERRALNDTFVTYALVGAVAIAITALITWLVMARLLQPISWLQRTTEEITEHDLKRRIPVRGNDDLAALTTTVNGMLDRLESAVEAQKSLLDDVGHELRTPMTIVRGHLELMDTTDPKDAEVVRALALEELARMSTLVNDLILLAQSERSDFVVLQDVDAGRLTDETFEKVRVLGDRRWIMDGLADVSFMVDPQRITQAWLQLAANAVKYSPEGTDIGIGSKVEGDNVRLWVRDHGMGFTEDEKELVLQRFGRSRRAGAKRTDSAGLGLAIVNSIALAHGGRVDIDSVPDLGSTVSLVIPRQPATEPTS
ncbi:MAG: HAMP domain-containing histidine kinase [Actinobacteria bacterium]|nr:HAMP domain-containing histidine kinase [Actinomycetota bacterium]